MPKITIDTLMKKLADSNITDTELSTFLKLVDPAHYAGWDGRLRACENDAIAMSNLAEAQGFVPTLLLTAEATRERVIQEIRAAAADLEAGDMFFLSVSCHGGRIPDLNADETSDPDVKMDETLCL